MKLLLIDNYDSFTYNLFQAFRTIGPEVDVIRNDSPSLESINFSVYTGIVISPGPGNPESAGESKRIIEKLKETKPILGVCLGMQCINEVYGGRTVKAPVPVHGKTSMIHHDNSELYRGIPTPFLAARYHSLVIDEYNKLEITSKTGDDIPMSITVPGKQIWGVQYHPESFLTPDGPQLLRNFISLCSV